jgi:hypothetical protein
MKKLAIAAAAVAAMSAGVANAYTSGTYANGFVVPNVIHNGSADTSAVGIVNRSGGLVPVNWVFFDENSVHVRDGCFPMTNNDYEAFIWSQQSGLGMQGKRGYLVFALGQTAAGSTAATVCNQAAARLPLVIPAAVAPLVNPLAGAPAGRITGSAFHVNTAAKDVAFLPVIDGNLLFSRDVITNARNLRTLTGEDVTAVAGAVTIDNFAGAPVVGSDVGVWQFNNFFDLPPSQVFTIRYGIDNSAGGVDTTLVSWSTGDQRGSNPTVFMYNDAQADASVNLTLVNRELNANNVEAIVGRPATFRDGFIEWTVTPATYLPFVGGVKVAPAGAPAAADQIDGNYRIYSAYTYSVISAPAFGAVQTMLGAHHQ